MEEFNSASPQLLANIFPFSELEDRERLRLAPYIERLSYAKGSMIVEQNAPTKAIFFILSGQVEISLVEKKKTRLISILNAGDHFGEDVLKGSGIARTSALCTSRLIVLRIPREKLVQVYEGAPVLKRMFDLFYRTYRLVCSLDLPWRQPSETVYILTRRTRFILWMRFFPLLLLSLVVFSLCLYGSLMATFANTLWLVLSFLALAFGLFLTGWSMLEWSNDYFILTRDRVLMQRVLIGIFDSRQETPVTAILSTGLDSSFMGRIFGFGNVTARAYTGDLRLPNLPDPDLIFAVLEYRRLSMIKEQKRQEQQGMETLLVNRLLSSGQHVTQPIPIKQEVPAQVNYYSGDFFDLLAKFFNLRIEKDGAVIYRTHWWMLLKKTFFPSLSILADLIMIVLRALGVFSFSAPAIYLLGIVAALAGWGWWFYQYTDWHNDVYIISADQLMDVNRKPLGHEDKRSAPIKNIQTVEYARKGIVALMLNFGTVSIRIGNETFTFDNVYNPSTIQIEIFNRYREVAEHSRRMEQTRIADYITIYDKLKSEKPTEEDDRNFSENG